MSMSDTKAININRVSIFLILFSGILVTTYVLTYICIGRDVEPDYLPPTNALDNYHSARNILVMAIYRLND